MDSYIIHLPKRFTVFETENNKVHECNELNFHVFCLICCFTAQSKHYGHVKCGHLFYLHYSWVVNQY